MKKSDQKMQRPPIGYVFSIFLALFCLDAMLCAFIYWSTPSAKAYVEKAPFFRSNFKDPQNPLEVSRESYLRLREIPPELIDAILFLEDSRFFEHRGFDPLQIYWAIYESQRSGRHLRGASTLSQQLAKNLFLSPDRSFWRKFREAIITLRLELELSKEQILELYLNSVDWGPGIIGAERAARYYFNKPASALTPYQSVYLAAILPNPIAWSKAKEKTFLRRRIIRSLEQLYQNERLALKDYRQALAEMKEHHD